MKVNVRSLKIVTSTGVTIPAWPWVRALNCLTNSMMLTPWGPSAVPTGGAGVACPAGTWSFTTAVIGLAIRSLSMSLQLQVVELDRGRPPEQGYGDADLPLVGQHLFHRSGEVRERPLGDLHDLSHQERDLLLGLLFLHGLLDAEEPIRLFLPQRLGQSARPDELFHALDAVDDVDGLLIQDHVHQHVPGIDLELLPRGPGDLADLPAHVPQELGDPDDPVAPRGRSLGAGQRSRRHYLDSLCGWCRLHRGQYFFHSTRSECFRRFFVVK